jgi:hypothetical protein
MYSVDLEKEEIFRLYIDESGDHTYGKLDDVGQRYLCLLGAIIRKDNYSSLFEPEMNNLKKKHFSYDPDFPVIFHRDEIVGKKGCFGVLKDPNKEKLFNEDLLNFFNQMDYVVIAIVIDKYSHLDKHKETAFNPYDYLLELMLERYAGYFHYFRDKTSCNCRGDVLAESRGGNEDKELKQTYERIYTSGTRYKDSSFFQSVLTSKEIKLKKKEFNIAGLQLSDLLASPAKKEILRDHERIDIITDFEKKVVCILDKKYNRNWVTGEIEGYGKKLI